MNVASTSKLFNQMKLFNAVMTSLLLAVMVWVGKKTVDTGEAVVALTQVVDLGKEARLTAQAQNSVEHLAINDRLNELVSRREFDTKILSIESELKNMGLRLKEIDMDLLKLKTKLNPNGL